MLRLLSVLFLMTSVLPVSAHELVERADWQEAFRARDLTGVLVLCRGDGSRCETNDSRRAKQRFIPASTYKIPHALIALETGVVRDGRQVFIWDGQPRAYAVWEQNFDLRGAMQNSVVPIYQRFARAIGPTRMRDYLTRMAYGNADIGGGIDRFWLDGELKISALEQIDFLQRLYHDALPFSERNQLIVRNAMLAEADSDHVLRAKTGYSAGMPDYTDHARAAIGWWVGWIEKGTTVHFFAANFTVDNTEQLVWRTKLPRLLLQAEDILSE